ncbi:hypothetical protein GF389_06085 [Candidatus Dojkabacteria bacterium]|nr:hypothetical protein [Candidatus Dojkabacteria bacterium]
MKKRNILLLSCILFVALILCCCFGIGAVSYIGSQVDDNDVVQDNKNEKADTPSEAEVNLDIPSIQIKSINDPNIQSPKAEQVQINEILLARDTFKLLENTNWSGDADDELPLSISDYNQSKLRDYIENQEKKTEIFTIPSEIEEVFSSDESASETRSLMLLARQEYLDYLKAKNVNEKYIEEMDTNVLPADEKRIQYYPQNDPEAPPSSVVSIDTGDGKKDYSRVNMDLYAVDVYNGATNICRSRVFGEPDSEYDKDYWEKCRNMSVRHLMYHEMTHVLHRAYTNQHVDEEFRSKNSSYVNADKTMVDIDNQYFWSWGNTTVISRSNNRQISQESQADGISYEMLVNNYDMSMTQKDALWDHMFGRLDSASVALDEIKSSAESNWPEFSPDRIGTMIRPIMRDYNKSGESTLVDLSLKMSNFPTYIGYLNPVEPDDTYLIWDFLEN